MYPLDRRNVAIRIYSILRSLRKTGAMLNVCHTTVMRWLKNTPKPQKKRKTFKSDEIVPIIRSSVICNPFVSTRQLKKIIHNVLDIDVSLELVRTVIKKLGYTRKKAKKFSNPPHLSELTNTFLQKRKEYLRKGKRFLSIDETSFGRNGIVTTGYSMKGTRLYVEKKTPTLVSLSSLACVSSNGWIKIHTRKGSFNSQTFLDFLTTLPLTSHDVILLDNVRFHHSKEVKEFLNSKGVELLFTPPYSPWFNPIELCFSIVKRHYSYHQSIDDAFSSLEPRHFQAFFNKSLNAMERF